MAKRKAEPTPVQATETPTRPIRLDIPADVHRLLRLIAADEEVSMAAFARDFLARGLADEAKRRGIKG